MRDGAGHVECGGRVPHLRAGDAAFDQEHMCYLG